MPSGEFLPEDIDLALADRFHTDPHRVMTEWPEELFERALSYLLAESEGPCRCRAPHP